MHKCTKRQGNVSTNCPSNHERTETAQSRIPARIGYRGAGGHALCLMKTLPRRPATVVSSCGYALASFIYIRSFFSSSRSGVLAVFLLLHLKPSLLSFFVLFLCRLLLLWSELGSQTSVSGCALLAMPWQPMLPPVFNSLPLPSSPSHILGAM